MPAVAWDHVHLRSPDPEGTAAWLADILGGVIKPIVFGFIIAAIACQKGLSTEGGTVGVGRSTTRAVVSASIVVIITDFFLARGLQYILDMPK